MPALMTPYISAERFRTMGFGTDLTNVEDAELSAVLTRASAMVDAYTGAPQLPQPHHFAGGSVTSEQHKWTLGTETRKGSRRIYVWHRPVREIASFSIRVTNQLRVTVGPNDLFINNTEGYCELISLAAVTFGIFPVGVVPNLGLYTPVAEIDYTYGREFDIAGEELFATDGQTYRAANGYWTPEYVIYEDGIEMDPADYEVNLVDGSVKFAGIPTGTISADYTYTMPRAVAQATGEIAADMLADKSLTAKGMRLLAAVRIGEVDLRRSLRGTSVIEDLRAAVPEGAALLLDPFRFRSIQ